MPTGELALYHVFVELMSIKLTIIHYSLLSLRYALIDALEHPSDTSRPLISSSDVSDLYAVPERVNLTGLPCN
jgi:hypothetical protein